MSKLMPEDWEPPYPAYVADVDHSHLSIAQLGMQSPDSEKSPRDWNDLLNAVDGATGLWHREHVFHVDSENARNDILLTYWGNPADFSSWWGRAETQDLVGRIAQGQIGIWVESMSSPAGHFETSYSTFDPDWGIARHCPAHEDPVHAYYGSMRDRIDAAEDGGLSSPISRLNRPRERDTRNRHLTVDPPENVCFIRTVQGWLACSQEEREYFLKNSHRIYQRGVDFLRGNSVETNCLSARLVSCTDERPNRPQTETLAWFLSLSDLEAWTWSHPTHAAIFNTFLKHAEKFDFDVKVLLGHEVLVMPKGAVAAEYHNCHGSTGFLPFFDPVDL